MSDDRPIEPVDSPAQAEGPSRADAAAANEADTTDESIGAPARRPKRKQRTSPRQFLREVRSELRKVAWPGRKELVSYSLVVLVSVTLITLYITGLDQVFGALILRIFGA